MYIYILGTFNLVLTMSTLIWYFLKNSIFLGTLEFFWYFLYENHMYNCLILFVQFHEQTSVLFELFWYFWYIASSSSVLWYILKIYYVLLVHLVGAFGTFCRNIWYFWYFNIWCFLLEHNIYLCIEMYILGAFKYLALTTSTLIWYSLRN